MASVWLMGLVAAAEERPKKTREGDSGLAEKRRGK